MNAKRLLGLALAMGSVGLLGGCPYVVVLPVLGTWDYTESALTGYVRWNIRINGTIEQTDIGHGMLAGTLTWEMTSPADIRIFQDSGPNQWIFNGTLLTDDLMSGTWEQIAGEDTGTHGTWSAKRFP